MNERPAVRVVCVGEVLWDLIRGREHIGGAPFNVAAHLAKLGAEAAILTRVGTDARGEAARREMRRLDVDDALVQTDPVHPTGWARVDLSGDGVPAFAFPDDPAYDFIETDAALLAAVAASAPDAICFGTLAQRGEVTRRSLARLLDAVRTRVTFYDVNIRRDFLPADLLRESLARTTVVKLNADEAPPVAMRLFGSALPEGELAARLSSGFGVQVLCVTKGADGCTVHAAGRHADVPGERVGVADTVGAGDAFSAAFLAHYLRTGDPFESARLGNRLGAYVASRPGAVPDYDDAIRRRLGL